MPVATTARVAPVVAAAGCGPAIGWFRHGSIASGDWMQYAGLVALVVATAAIAGALLRPTRPGAIAIAALAGLGLWEGVTIFWTAVPNLARDEAGLTITYALVLLLAVSLPASRHERLLALEGTSLLFGAYAVACALRFRFGAHPLFGEGRAADPISYINAGAALWALGFWPGIAAAARRGAHPVTRAACLGAAAVSLAGVVTAQSKGAVLGLLLSAVVVFALSGRRTRLAVPAAIATAVTVAAAAPLTGPYRARPDHLEAAINTVGTAMLGVCLIAAVAGLAYTLLDRRMEPAPSTVRRTGLLTAWAVAAAAVAGIAVILAPHPIRKLQHDWRAAHHSSAETATTHLAALGSNRFDFWRVALDGSVRHPLFGIGARGFGPYYLIRGRSYETPARAHSLPLEVLLEDGAVGLILLGMWLGAVFTGLVAGARARRATSIAGLGATAAAVGQMCVDWTWTFPAVGLPLFVLAGLGLQGSARPLSRIGARAVAGCALAAALLVFFPTYLSARIATQAVFDRAPGRLKWAARVDPLSPAPDIARYELAATSDAQLVAARALVRRQPRSVAYQYLYGEALAAARRPDAARAALLRALALHPGDRTVRRALRGLRGQ